MVSEYTCLPPKEDNFALTPLANLGLEQSNLELRKPISLFLSISCLKEDNTITAHNACDMVSPKDRACEAWNFTYKEIHSSLECSFAKFR